MEAAPSLPRRLFPRAPAIAVTVLLACCVGFRELQNTVGWIGGSISLAKTLWLGLTLTSFYILPWFLWRNRLLSSAVRNLFGVLLLGFVLRAGTELVVIYATHGWRCIYGISHDFASLAFIFVWLRLQKDIPSPVDRRARRFLFPFIVTLLCEMTNAWLFSRIANPGTGTYFAADTPHFHFVNALTWGELALLWPSFGWFLWSVRDDF